MIYLIYFLFFLLFVGSLALRFVLRGRPMQSL